MALEQQELESVNLTTSTDTTALTGVDTENLPKLLPASQPENQWQDQISQFLDQFPQYFNRFLAAYTLPLISLAIVLGAVVTLKVVIALLDAINDLPLLEPTFEVIGIVYSSWFAFRYLIKASTRQELAAEIDSLKAQILG